MAPTPYVIVTGSDFSANAARALGAAYEQARGHTPAELHVVHASLMTSCEVSAPILTLDEQREQLARYLDRQLPSVEGFPEPGVKVFGHVILEVPSLAIVALASELRASLIVVGTHGLHGLARWLLGSVAEGVVRRAECPVLVVPPPGDATSTTKPTASAPTVAYRS